MESSAVRVLLFADLRRLAGSAELELRLSDPVSAGVIWERLCADHAGLRGLTETVRPALNRA
ncbi:MAG: MoaD/ThiS family protein [Candidatus Dormibacteria bacterium]